MLDDVGPPANGHGSESSVGVLVEQVLDLLRARGGRVTTSRRLLLQCLFEDSAHRNAEELAIEVHAKAPDVHLSTIYRNLEELERLGVITHSHLGHGPATYHLSTKVHGHLVCEDCGTAIEAPDDLFTGLARDAYRRFGFVIDPHHFAVLGHCPACRPTAGSAGSVEVDRKAMGHFMHDRDQSGGHADRSHR